MDLGIPTCAVIGCPNKSKLNPLTFKAQLGDTNINFTNQPIPAILSQHEPYYDKLKNQFSIGQHHSLFEHGKAKSISTRWRQ